MKKLASFCFFLFTLGLSTYAQQNPVQWFANYKALNATEGEIMIMATIEKGAHIYSQRPTEAGPISTSFIFNKSKDYILIGKTEEIGVQEAYDKVLEATVFSFSNKAEFRQKIKLLGKMGLIVPFKIEFVCCNDMMCMPAKMIDLSVKTQ